MMHQVMQSCLVLGHQKRSHLTWRAPGEQADDKEMLNNKARHTGCSKSLVGLTGLVLMLDGQQDLGVTLFLQLAL